MSSAQGDYTIGSSSAYATASLALHVSAVVALQASRLDGAVLIAITLLLVPWTVRDLRRAGCLRGGAAVSRVRVRSHDWYLLRRDGTIFGPARPVTGHAGAFGLLLVLRDVAGRRCHLTLPADALRGDDLRRLRAHARMALGGGTA